MARLLLGGRVQQARDASPFWQRDGGQVAVEEVSVEFKTETIYNFEVAHLHNYAIGTHGYLVHNANQRWDKMKDAVRTGFGAFGWGKRPGVTKPPLSAHKDALKKVHEQVGKLPKGKPGKFGSPQAGTSRKGYRLDPPHPNAKPGTPETGYHINWWDWTLGKKGRGGRHGAVPIEGPY